MNCFFAIFIFSFSLLMCAAAYGDETDTLHYQPTCNQGVYGLCGYYNRATFKRGEPLDWLIAPKFEEASAFNEGLAVVKLNGKFGFIDQGGKFKIKPTYDSVGSFYKGLAPFQNDGLIGFINSTGKTVVPAKFSSAIAINESTIIATDNADYKFASSKLLPSLNEPYVTSLNSRKASGLYDLKKGWLTDQKYFFKPFNTKNHDLLWVKERRGKTGLMRIDGSWLKKTDYVDTQPLNEGLAIVTVEQDDGLKLWGAVNEKGKLVIPEKFEWLSSWVGDYALTRIGDYNSKQKGLVDRDGNLLGSRYFEDIQRPGNYFTATDTVFLPRVKSDGKWYSLTPKGELIADQKKRNQIAKESVLSCDNFVLNRTEDGLTAKDKAGKKIVGFDYNSLLDFTLHPEALNVAKPCDAPLSISWGGKYSYLLPEGILFANRFLDSTASLHENVAEFSEGGKWGLINSTGKVVLDPAYDRFSGYDDGRYIFTKGEDLVAFDKNGIEYDLEGDPNYSVEFRMKIAPRETYLKCSASTLQSKGWKWGLFPKRRKWGLVSDDGDIILPFKYRALSCYKNGVAWAPRDDLKKWCPMNRQGKFLSEDRCEPTVFFDYGPHVYPEPLAEDPYESSVLWALQYLNFGQGREARPPLLLPDGYRRSTRTLMRPNPYVRD